MALRLNNFNCDPSDGRGFTLLEVMVSVAILAIALVAILKANVQSLDTLVETRERTTLYLLAARKMAEVEAVGVRDWSEFQGDFGEDYPDFTWRVDTAPTEVDNLARVTVIVQAREGEDGSEVSIEQLRFVQ
jgi:general secretion pathway protein I